MNRKQKLQTIKSLLSGDVTLKDIRTTPVFLTHRQCSGEPHVYYDDNQQPLSQEAYKAQLKAAEGHSFVWPEILTYENKTALVNSYKQSK